VENSLKNLNQLNIKRLTKLQIKMDQALGQALKEWKGPN
jgi:hypothetical protein